MSQEKTAKDHIQNLPYRYQEKIGPAPQTNDETLRAKVDAWMAQTYTNGGLDTYAAPQDVQGYESCTELIMQIVEAAVLAGQIEAAKHVQQICPTTEGASVERLHHRIDTYLGQLQAQQVNINREKS